MIRLSVINLFLIISLASGKCFYICFVSWSNFALLEISNHLGSIIFTDFPNIVPSLQASFQCFHHILLFENKRWFSWGRDKIIISSLSRRSKKVHKYALQKEQRKRIILLLGSRGTFDYKSWPPLTRLFHEKLHETLDQNVFQNIINLDFFPIKWQQSRFEYKKITNFILLDKMTSWFDTCKYVLATQQV